MAGLRVLGIWMLPRSTIPPPVKPVSGRQVWPSASTKGDLEPASMRMAFADVFRAGMVEAVILVGWSVGAAESEPWFLFAQPQMTSIARASNIFVAFMTSFR